MGLLSFLKGLFGLRHKRRRKKGKRRKKKRRPVICNILRFYVGSYVSDSGDFDYDVNYKVKGKVRKRILQRPRRGEESDIFKLIQLTPVAKSAFVRITKTDVSTGSWRGMKHRPSYVKSWHVILKKSHGKKPKILKLNTK